ncbi:dipicolinate synthase subunit DpsA [Youxingia wuxianensis]|uniref:Dipicolinate synthase subunit DpsA n=1 Tax=Youxingia wuxianensis TaxID=2763678 RepID=A0A926ELK7_9FIRM|nr:dipicolinate synthase subunit DpsA [Youxingia wuxianensis]MBC8584123.1 dipicolinate synthase subunit DpsA [Youxingia wuxianensis]
MNKQKTFAVVGGDLRQVHVANRLSGEGYQVYGMLLETNMALDESVRCTNDISGILPKCDVVILPMPVTTDDVNINAPFTSYKVRVEDCIKHLNKKSSVFGGKINQRTKDLAEKTGIELVDYLEREELAVLNGVITAEGALAIAMEELPISIFQSRCVVVGHGRIAKVLARYLKAMGAQVTVAARKYSDLAWISAENCKAVHIRQLSAVVREADVLFNTVPAHILNREVLSHLKTDALVIDLASKPGGVDLDDASELGVKTIWALSLPGKVAPITAGEIVLSTIFNCLDEKGEL